MRQGHLFETLLRLIREAINDQPGLEIKQNVKLTDLTGDNREFDVVIESKLNEFVTRIIFECKDTRSPVKVEKIEAFKAKIDSLPGANKGVFVSKSGYQRLAVKKAQEKGITLISMGAINKEKVAGMLAVLRIQIQQIEFRLEKTWLVSKGKKYDALSNNLRLQKDSDPLSEFDATAFFAECLFPRTMELFPDLPEFVERQMDVEGDDISSTLTLSKIEPGYFFTLDKMRHYCTTVEFEVKHKRLIQPLEPSKEWEYKNWSSSSPEAQAYEYDPDGLGFKIIIINTGRENSRLFLLDRNWNEICPNLPGLFCRKQFTIRLPSRLKVGHDSISEVI